MEVIGAQVSVAELGNSDVEVVERTITFNVEKSLFRIDSI